MLQHLILVLLLSTLVTTMSQVTAENLTMENSSAHLKSAFLSGDLQGDLTELNASPFISVLFEAIQLTEMMERFKNRNIVDGKLCACKVYPVHPGLRIVFMASVYDKPIPDMNTFFEMALGQIDFHKIPSEPIRGVSAYGAFNNKKWYSWLPGVQGYESYLVVAIATDCQLLKDIQRAYPNAKINPKATSTLISLIIDYINTQQDTNARTNSRAELDTKIRKNFAYSPQYINGTVPEHYSLQELDDLAVEWFTERDGLLDVLRTPDVGISTQKNSRFWQPSANAHEESAYVRSADGIWTLAFGYTVFLSELRLDIIFIPENTADTDKYFLSSLKRSTGASNLNQSSAK